MLRSTHRRALRALVAASLAAAGAGTRAPSAGAQAPARYDAAHVHVEVLGLKRWTLDMLRDSVRAKSGGEGLESAACQVVLRDSLHFADALVNSYYGYERDADPADHWLVLKVVEPGDAARVRWAAVARDSFRLVRPTYAAFVGGATDSAGNLYVGRVVNPLQRRAWSAAERARLTPSQRADVVRLDRFLAAHRSASDWRTARGVLRDDPVYANRLAAAVVLANFVNRDSTWWSLVDALRDPNEAVRGAAEIVLSAAPARPVDWTPVTPTLRLLLGGTNVGATQPVMELLVRTRVAPSLAAPLLRDNGDWVLTHLRAESPAARPAARALLARLAGGRDLGDSASAWQEWIGGLR